MVQHPSVAWFEEVANEIAASVAIVDQVNDEGSIGEVVEHLTAGGFGIDALIFPP